MEYVQLGNTETKVSKICLGTMTWGEQNSEAEAHAQLDYAIDRGVNFIDAAEMYPVPPRPETQGRTEEYLGSWLARQSDRQRFIIATKVAGPGDWLNHIRGGSRLNEAHINAAIDASLARLRTDYVDLYQLHWPERTTNFFGQLGYRHDPENDGIALEETLTVIKQLLESGKIRHWGLSNETPWGVMSAIRVAEQLGMPAPVSIQNPYNLLNRSFEVGLAECSLREKVGLLAYSPLAFGVLSGKYLGGLWPENCRLTLYKRFSRYTNQQGELATKAYKTLADEIHVSLTQLALAFVNSRSFVTSNIIGATSLEQLAENIDSVNVKLDETTLKELDRLHEVHTIPCP